VHVTSIPELEQAALTLGRVLQKRRLAELRLPNLIGVGTARAGSTYLHQILRAHPDVYAAPAKEVNYFGILSRNAMTLREYTLMFMGQADERYISETTPVYLHSERAMAEIARVLDRPRILITLREPVSRLVSHFRFHRQRHGYGDLEDYLDAAVAGDMHRDRNWNAPSRGLLLSVYADAVERAFATFGRENCCVLNHADLAQGPERWCDQLAGFLDLDMSAGAVGPTAITTTTEESRLPDSGAGRRIAQMFEEDARRLSTLLGAGFVSAWRP
jgi:sulfotransferase family protein